MGDGFKGWKASSITLIAATLLAIACLQGRGAFDRPAGNALQASPPTAFGIEATHARDDASDAAIGVPDVSVHVCIVRFTASSPNAQAVVKDFEARLETALADFNSHGNPQPGGFAASDELAALLKDFESKGQGSIHDEKPRRISSGATDNWGTSISLSATPSVESTENMSVSVSAVFGASQLQASIKVQPRHTVILGGSTTCETGTHLLRVPILEQIPIVGSKLFSYPVTRTTGTYERLLLSAAILP